MRAFRNPIALLLLLCLMRTLLPEAWILALHAHAHTAHEPAQVAAFRREGKALLSAPHQHCPVEQFYNGAFQPAGPVAAPTPPAAVKVYATAPRPGSARAAAWRAGKPAALRGPPRRA